MQPYLKAASTASVKVNCNSYTQEPSQAVEMNPALWDAKHDWLYLKIKVVHWEQVKVILTLFRNDLLIDWKANQRGWPTHDQVTMLHSLLSHSSVGTGWPGLSKWAIIMACNYTPLSPSPSFPPSSVCFSLQCEAIRDCMCWCVWFVCVSSDGLSTTPPN